MKLTIPFKTHCFVSEHAIDHWTHLIGGSGPCVTLNITNALLFLPFNKENCSCCGVISLVIEFLIDCCFIMSNDKYSKVEKQVFQKSSAHCFVFWKFQCFKISLQHLSKKHLLFYSIHFPNAKVNRWSLIIGGKQPWQQCVCWMMCFCVCMFNGRVINTLKSVLLKADVVVVQMLIIIQSNLTVAQSPCTFLLACRKKKKPLFLYFFKHFLSGV